MLNHRFTATSNFEVHANIIVITKAVNSSFMVTDIQLINIDEEESLDRSTAERLAKIIEFLLNIED
jgi:hypothetical protein